MVPVEKKTLEHVLMWIVLLLIVLLPPLVAVAAIGFFGMVQLGEIGSEGRWAEEAFKSKPATSGRFLRNDWFDTPLLV